MKKAFITFITLTLLTLYANAQLRYQGQWATEINAGPTLKKGFYISAGIEKYFSSATGSLEIHLNYMRNAKYITIRNFHISTITLSAAYFYSFETIIRPPFFVNMGLGFFAGAETFEKITKLPQGVIQNAGTKITGGISFKPQAEYLIRKKISLFIQPQVDYYLKSKFYDFHFIPTIGIKAYL